MDEDLSEKMYIIKSYHPEYLSCNLRELIHISNERLCRSAQWEIREQVQQMVSLVAPELHFMLVPKCQSGRIICNDPCNK